MTSVYKIKMECGHSTAGFSPQAAEKEYCEDCKQFCKVLSVKLIVRLT